MDEESDTSSQLSSNQTEKVIQFQDLTGIEDFDRCKQILSAHNWDLETAFSLAVDDRIDNTENTPSQQSTLRHRIGVHSSTAEIVDTNQSSNNNNNNALPSETRLTIWSFTTRLITSPFTFIYDTILSILRFALSIIRTDPTRSITSSAAEEINSFITELESEYGSTHPRFYRGSYSEALNEAKRELKFLLVYLHCESHQHTRQFCQTILTNQQLIDFITQNNLLFWSCSVRSSEGYRVSQSLRESTYPFLALIGLKQNRMLVIKKFEGKQTIEALLAQLRKSIDDNEAGLIAARLEREERNMNQLLRQQQDQAFAESLRADQEKERKKMEEKTKKEAEEKAKKDKEVEASKRIERLLQLKVSLVDQIPPEPDIGDTNATKIVIKLPNGTRLERRFLKTQSIKYLYYFVFCHNQSPLHFQIRTNLPTRDLPGKSPTLDDFDSNTDNNIKQTNGETDYDDEPPTFEECDLHKGAMLFVNDLEA